MPSKGGEGEGVLVTTNFYEFSPENASFHRFPLLKSVSFGEIEEGKGSCRTVPDSEKKKFFATHRVVRKEGGGPSKVVFGVASVRVFDCTTKDFWLAGGGRD